MNPGDTIRLKAEHRNSPTMRHIVGKTFDVVETKPGGTSGVLVWPYPKINEGSLNDWFDSGWFEVVANV